MGTEHKQVRVRGCGQEADVDEGIAPLIKEMWRAGIRTSMSCQAVWSVMEISAADLVVLAKATDTLPRLESARSMSLAKTRRQALGDFEEKLKERQTTEYLEDTTFLPGR